MTELGVLARDVGVHERTLRRAVNQGTLRGHRRSPRTLELPLSERLYVRRSWPLIATLRSALRAEQNVRLAVLFGSTARGTDTPASDIDVLVRLRDPGLERVVDLEERLAKASGRRVEVVRLEAVRDDPSFLGEVLEEGRVLVDREEVWSALRSREPALRRRRPRDEGRRVEAALAGIDRLLAG